MSKFIVLEGMEGSGKTTLAFQILRILKKYGINDVIVTREPGGTPISETLRSFIKVGKDGEHASITSYSELLIFYTARIQLLENVIKPALLNGTWVIGDRYDLSSRAYQGGGRGISTSFIKYLSQVLLNGFNPDVTFYLDIPPEIGLERVKKVRHLDCIEKESVDFFNRVRLSYQSLANENKNIVTIDATQSLSKVYNDVHQYLKKWLKYLKV